MNPNHIIFGLLLLGMVVDPFLTNWLKKSTNPMKRINTYIVTMVTMSSLSAASLTLGSWSPFWSWPPHPGWTAGAILFSGLLLFVLIQTFLKIRRKPELVDKTDKAFSKLSYLLPQTTTERRWFIPLCISAGINEEIFCRGFLVSYFHSTPYGMIIPAAVITAALIFGLNHFYQGLHGVIFTFVFGLVFTVIVLGFGSLIPAIILHALVDLRVLLMTKPKDAVTSVPSPINDPA